MGNTPGPVWDVQNAITAVKILEPFDLLLLEAPLYYTDPRGYELTFTEDRWVLLDFANPGTAFIASEKLFTY